MTEIAEVRKLHEEQSLTSGAYSIREMGMTGSPHSRLSLAFGQTGQRCSLAASALQSDVLPQPSVLSRIFIEKPRPRVMSETRVVAVDRGGKEVNLAGGQPGE